MKRILAFVLGLSLVASAALAQDANFTLVNATGYPIRELYVSPSKQSSWGSDVLGKHTIEPREAWNITFPQSRSACRQDLRIIFDDDGSEVIWENFNLCEITKITLSYNRKSGETTATYE